MCLGLDGSAVLDGLVEAMLLDPPWRLPRCDVLRVEVLDILEGQTLCLGDHKVYVEPGKDEDGAEDEHDEGTVLGGDLVGEVAEEEVPEPVTCASERDGLGSGGGVEGLGEVEPGAGAEAAAVEDEVDDGERDEHGAGLVLRSGDHVGRRILGCGLVVTDKGDDERARSFARSTDEEQRPTSELLDGDQSGNGGEERCRAEDELDLEGVEGQGEGGAEEREIVVVEVLTVELLERLEHHAVDGTLPHLVLGGEADEVGAEVAVTGKDAVLLVDALLHLEQLGLHPLVAAHLAIDVLELNIAHGGHDLARTHHLAVLEATHGDLPGRIGGLEVLGGPADSVRDEDAKDDEQLVSSHHGTADVLGRGLAEVERAETRERTHAETGKCTADAELHPRRDGRGLDDGAHHECGRPRDHRGLAAKEVRNGRLEQRTDKGTDRERRVDERGSRVRKRTAVGTAVGRVTKGQNEGLHDEASRDDTDIVTEEEATSADGEGEDLCAASHL
ncbi:hypothetical protein L1887_53625 [Cichorium endivia]|nr:hypothetical protein L1887_53625 [Cichorium endivia]